MRHFVEAFSSNRHREDGMPALLVALIALALTVAPAAAAPRHRRHIVCAVAPIEGVGLFRFCPVPARRR